MTPGEFIAFFGFVGMLYPTVAQLMGTLAKMVRAGASLERIEEVLAEPAQDHHGGEFRGPVRGHLSFFWVSVKRGDKTVLKDITLEIPAGTFCIVTGPTGSGKSTLVSLVPRFIEPDHGRILIDTMDLGRAELKRLRDSVGIAFQESFLFNATVMENLRYAVPDATAEQVERVARITGADKMIEALPQGYETVLGENGWNLSRGEKQKLALTRALLKEPGILILDEATASIDVATEQSIIPRIQHFMRRRTTLMVTHRPELFHHADMLIVLDDGCVVYQGPPTDLPPDTLEELGILTPVLLPPQRRREEQDWQTVQLVTNGPGPEGP
jgi:ABC-type multidrug transport system fused ATPase/permease subunit